MTSINFNDYAIKLSKGKHRSPRHGMCVMECVAYIEGESHTDHPKCACPVVTAFAIKTNDWMTTEESSLLLPYILRIAGSKSGSDIEKKRAFMCADYAVRVFLPIVMRTTFNEEMAKKLEACLRIVDIETALAGSYVVSSLSPTSSFSYAAAAYVAAAFAATFHAASIASSYYPYSASALASALVADVLCSSMDLSCAVFSAARKDMVVARLRLLDEMLLLTDHVEVPKMEQSVSKLAELVEITSV